MNTITSSLAANSSAIVLHTRKGTDIDNFQTTELSAYDIKAAQELKKKYSMAEFRTNFIPIYNCHGMTFASRRTAVFEGTEVRQILSEDEYEEIPLQQVSPGDVIIYVDERGDIEHSGVVISKPAPPLNVPLVVSKWGKGPEVLHSAYYSPYSVSDIHFYRITK
ncbi:MAG: hypothetical protein KGS09_20850 [Nitrospirae bacterium]|nr:hypothetical protein [Nitrospirota bacterium]